MNDEVKSALKRSEITMEKGVYVLRLPDEQFDRKVYTAIGKALENIDGKWNRYQKGFVFKNDPGALLVSTIKGVMISESGWISFNASSS